MQRTMNKSRASSNPFDTIAQTARPRRVRYGRRARRHPNRIHIRESSLERALQQKLDLEWYDDEYFAGKD